MYEMEICSWDEAMGWTFPAAAGAHPASSGGEVAIGFM